MIPDIKEERLMNPIDFNPNHETTIQKEKFSILPDKKMGPEIKKDVKAPTPEQMSEMIQKNNPDWEAKNLRDNLDKLTRAAAIFNKKLKFTVNKEINRIIVKVVDANTNKVIKEIPPSEIQKLAGKIKQMLGILFDETV